MKEQQLSTRMHSSRMHTARFLPYREGVTLDRDPPGQRAPLDRDPTEQRLPLGQRPRPPPPTGRRPRPPRGQRPRPPPPPGQEDTCENITLPKTSFAGVDYFSGF